ncbi:M48 family metallopeptidase [Tannockella kyphosi]|uniref:M48 family metallopeptidase n=1 Tax=Tannockella kyphosi TaxID=2899121 RepID=UPI0020121774|nr:YgjP-like metallopeptidase domain-containing protein [Tannockella kyphosi]
MKKNILLNNQIYSYTITRKHQKNCYLRVNGGEIKVSAPIGLSIDKIEQFIITNTDALVQALDQFVSHYDYSNGGYVTIYGKRYPIRLEDRKQLHCDIIEGIMVVNHVNIEKVVSLYLKKELYNYCVVRTKEIIEACFHFKQPSIEIKKYKSRWGSYYHGIHKITLNQSLVHLPKDLIDYVIVHELCHVLQKNHSKLFYHEVALRMPDYKQREQRLKKENI